MLLKVLCGCLYGARFYSETKGNRGCRAGVRRGDEGWIRVRLASDSARCGRGERKKEKNKGRKVFAVGESCGGRDLSGVLSQAKNPYVSQQIEPALPPERSFKGAPSPTLSQRWIAICVLDMQGG